MGTLKERGRYAIIDGWEVIDSNTDEPVRVHNLDVIVDILNALRDYQEAYYRANENQSGAIIDFLDEYFGEPSLNAHKALQRLNGKRE